MRVIVLGGGFLGQLLLALHPDWRVFDWRPSRPTPEQETRAFGPQYLWQRPYTGGGQPIECRQFNVYTTIDGQRARTHPHLIEAYKRKVGKEQDGADWRAQFEWCMYGYEPTLSNEKVEYGQRVCYIAKPGRHGVGLLMSDGRREECDAVVSTIPLYALLPMIGLMDPGLKYRPIYCQVNASLEPHDENMHVDYISNAASSIYRVTRRNGLVYCESLEPILPESRKLLPGKIYPNKIATALVQELESEFNIYSCGRFATWNPEELAHESIERLREWA